MAPRHLARLYECHSRREDLLIYFFITGALFVACMAISAIADDRILKAASGGIFRDKSVIPTIKRWQRISAITALAALTLLALPLAVIVVKLIGGIERVISSPLFAFPVLCAGIILYRLRGTQPFAYGISEFCVAVVAIFVSITATNQGTLAKLLGIMGGIYIMIRGLDNIDKGLTSTSTLRAKWDILFPKTRN